MLPDDWSELAADQRLETRLDAWQNLPIEFASPEVSQGLSRTACIFGAMPSP